MPREDDLPDGTGPDTTPLSEVADVYNVAEDLASDSLITVQRLSSEGTLTWRDALLGEVFPTLALEGMQDLLDALEGVIKTASDWRQSVLDRLSEEFS